MSHLTGDGIVWLEEIGIDHDSESGAGTTISHHQVRASKGARPILTMYTCLPYSALPSH